jgi:thiamine biosynthesis lipoprotein
MLAASVLAGAACERPSGEVVEQTREIEGTPVTIKVYARPSDRLFRAIGEAFDRMGEVGLLLWEWQAGTDVQKINDGAGRAVAVSRETIRILDVARELSERSDGAFDVTWAVLRDAWGRFDSPGIDPKAERFQSKVKRLLERIGYDRVDLDAEAGTVRIEEGMRIGLGGLAKGMAVDEAAGVLRRMGYSDFVIDAGGDVLVNGRRGNRDWVVGIRHPRADGSASFAVFPLRDRAVSTTGDYERFIEVDGVRYSHLLDARTGYPAKACVSVTVIHPSSMMADALATAACLLGPTQGMALVRSYPDAEAVFVDPNLSVRMTPALEPVITTRWLRDERREP